MTTGGPAGHDFSTLPLSPPTTAPVIQRSRSGKGEAKRKTLARNAARAARTRAISDPDDPFGEPPPENDDAVESDEEDDEDARAAAEDDLKERALGLPEIDEETREQFGKAAETDDANYRISGKGLALSTEGEPSPFDREHPGGRVFWRADSRPPSKVLRTGLTPRVARDGGKQSNPDGTPRKNTMIYRTGDDDIVPASAVCVARDPRGACFFPFQKPGNERSGGGRPSEAPEGEDVPTYLYAMALRKTVSTVDAQRAAERATAGKGTRRKPERYRYDPAERDSANASSVWPYHEHAVHEVRPDQIVGAFRVSRSRLVDPKADANDIKAGMRFQIHPKDLARRGGKVRDEDRLLRQEALDTAKLYSKPYPNQPDHYLSYQGTVRKTGARPDNSNRAEEAATQVSPFPFRPGVNPRKLARKEKLALKKELKQRRKQR